MKLFNAIIIVLTTVILISCAHTSHKDGPPVHDIDVSRIPNATPHVEPKSKYGNPNSYVVKGKRYYPKKSSVGFKETGMASWYGTRFDKKLTSSREPYDMFGMTAAHKTLPLPTYLKVTNLENGRQVIVKVNDRGPFYDDRIIDLSYTAAKKLGVYPKGTAKVKIEAIDPQKKTTAKAKKSHTFYIQAGAFKSLDHARKFRGQLNALTGYNVKIRKTKSDGGPWYLVQVGPIDGVKEAHNTTARLEKNHVVDTILLRR